MFVLGRPFPWILPVSKFFIGFKIYRKFHQYLFVISIFFCFILLSKMWLFLNLVKHTSNFFIILRTHNLWLFFSSFSGCWVIQNFCNFSLIKSCKTYLRPILPPGGRNWQLIYANYLSCSSCYSGHWTNLLCCKESVYKIKA